MAKPQTLQPCPKCGGAIKIFPSYGGAGGNLTFYVAECSCGLQVDSLGTDGTRRSAGANWNRWAKNEKAKLAAGVAIPQPDQGEKR